MLLLCYHLRWVLGFFKYAAGYELGLVVSIAGVIVIGYWANALCLYVNTPLTASDRSPALTTPPIHRSRFSVDYVIHVAHMYTHASANKARGRVHFAVS